jgi:fructoselysine 6-kinase
MSLVAIGDNVTDCYVEQGWMFPGGNAVNTAVHAARAGTPTAYVGVVGDDERGRLLLEALAAEGVNSSGVRALPGPTAYAVVRHVDGERVFGPNDKGVSVFRPTATDLARLTGARLAHTSYASRLEAVVPLLASAAPVSFDFNDRTGDGYADALLPHVQVATFSAAHLDDAECEELVRWAHSRGPRHVFATRGPAGAMAYDGRRVHRAAAVAVRAVDSLGAGDAFIGRALHGLLAGETTRDLLTAAVRAGSAACAEVGGFGHGRPLSDDVVGLGAVHAV